jgi:hypothetical protein
MPAHRIFVLMSAIHYSELLKLFEEADHERGNNTLSLVYLSCNRNKKTGGEWVRVENVKKCGLPYHCADHEMRGIMHPNGKIDAIHLRLTFEVNGQQVYP